MKKLDPNKLDSRATPSSWGRQSGEYQISCSCLGLYWPQHLYWPSIGPKWPEVIIGFKLLGPLWFMLRGWLSSCIFSTDSFDRVEETPLSSCLDLVLIGSELFPPIVFELFLLFAQTIIWNCLLWLIELSCIKIIKQTARGRSNDQMILKFMKVQLYSVLKRRPM